MPVYQLSHDRFEALRVTSFEQIGVKERGQLQRLLRDCIEMISPDTLIISEEFGDWEDSRRRIDLLGIDKNANLVVIELKRTEDGGHMELQALRYAAMVAGMTFEDAVRQYSEFLRGHGKSADARDELLNFLSWRDPSDEEFGQEVRIVLASANFSKELTTCVMWLNDEYGLDIRCVRLQPYSHAAGIFVDAQQVIPLPEAADYQVQLRKKQQEERKENIERVELRERFYVGLLDRAKARGSVPIEFTLSKGAYAVSISSGFVGFPFVYVAMKDAARVELYIDRYGRRQFNKSAYDYLHGKREQIEGAFGGELLWERLDEKNACRISCTDTAGGYRSNVSEWPRIQDQMVDAMIRLSAALSQHLQAAIDTAELAQANPVGQSSPTPA